MRSESVVHRHNDHSLTSQKNLDHWAGEVCEGCHGLAGQLFPHGGLDSHGPVIICDRAYDKLPFNGWLSRLSVSNQLTGLLQTRGQEGSG
jgi:hypothetical protein